jgi:signal transduction histidine kinase/CheY-like chemotaxis protein
MNEKDQTIAQIIEELRREKSKRLQLKTALQKSQEQLHQSQKMETLGTLVAGVAHEINNPINLVMYNTSLLKKVWWDFLPVLNEYAERNPDQKFGGLTFEFLNQNLKQLIADVDMAANRVAKIITDLKDFAKQSSIMDKQPLQINQAIMNAIRLVGATLKKAGIEVQLELDPDVPLMEGNLHNIEQVVLNIVINAVQAVNHDNGLIKISTGYQNRDKRILLTIADNGKGIDPSISNKIFDPFVTDKQAEGGTGLGLSVTYSLIHAHNGEITFQSQKGKGTAFTVYFPTVTHDKGPKILIVDDDQAVRQMLIKSLMKSKSYRVEEASNGIEACIKLGSYRPDLLILDVFMPDMDGLEVCRAIKKDSSLVEVKVIITTGFPNHPKIKEVAKLGFSKIHFKPFDLPEFVQRIDQILAAT